MAFLLATGHEPLAIPSPRTTYYAPRTRRGGHAGPPLRRDNTHHEPRLQATSYRPHAAFTDSPDEAGWSGRDPRPMPEEKPRFGCRQCLNVGEGFKPSPTSRGPKTLHGAIAGHKLRATGHPVTISLRTSTHRADTRVRPYDGITRVTSNDPQLQATSYRPHAAISSFQPSEPWLARVGPDRRSLRCSWVRRK